MMDRYLMRTKDITIVLGMVVIVMYLFNLSSHIVHWDDAVKKMDNMELQMATNSTSIAVLNAQYFEINKKLETIDRHTR